MNDHDAKNLLERVRELILELERTLPGTRTEMEPFPSGAIMLNVRRNERLFVLAYIRTSGWFGVAEVHEEDGFGDHYPFAVQSFEEAADELRRLVGET